MLWNNALAACRIRVGQTRVKYKKAHVSHLYLRRMYIKFMHLWQRGLEQRSRYSDSLLTGRSWDLTPVGKRFSALVQTSPGAHPTSYIMGIGSFPGVKQPGRGLDQRTSSSAEFKERVELYLYSPPGPSWPLLGSTSAYAFTLLSLWQRNLWF